MHEITITFAFRVIILHVSLTRKWTAKKPLNSFLWAQVFQGWFFYCCRSCGFLQKECEKLSTLFWKHFTTTANAVSGGSLVIHPSVSNSRFCLECKLLRTGMYHTSTTPSRAGSCPLSGSPTRCRNITAKFCNVEDAGDSVTSYLGSCEL